jgi:hypothetical protein
MADMFRFAAFISYASKDAAFARRLHRALEGYGVPTSLGQFDLTGGGKKNRIYPVFRDREELPSGDLGAAIQAALQASNALIIVCSPNAAASPWVNKEIESFLALGRRDRIFAIIHPHAPVTDAGGRDATLASFPPAFRGEGLTGGLEPLAADARPGKDGFRNAWLKIVAGLIGVNAGALADRDRRRRNGQALQAGLAASLAVAGLGITGQWIEAGARREALANWPAIAAQEKIFADPMVFAIAAAGERGALLLAEQRAAADTLRIKAGAPIVRTLAKVAPQERIELAPRETRFAAWGADGIVRTWPIAPDAPPTVVERPGEIDLVAGLSFSDDDSALLIRSDWMEAETRDDPEGGRAQVVHFDAARQGQTTTFTNARLAEMSGNGRRLSIKQRDGRTMIYDLAAPSAPPWELPSADRRAWLRWSPDGRALLLDLRDGSLAMWTFADGAPPARKVLPKAPLDADIRFLSRGDFLTVRPIQDNAVSQLIDLRGAAKSFNIGLTADILDGANGVAIVQRPDQITSLVTLYPSPSEVTLPKLREVRLSRDRQRVVVETPDGVFAALDLKPGNPNVISIGQIGPSQRWALSPDGATIAIESKANQIAVYPVIADAKPLFNLQTPAQTRSLILADGARRLFVKRRDAPPLAIDLAANGAQVELADAADADMTSDGAYALTVSADGLARQYDLARPLSTPAGAAARTIAETICAAQADHLRPFGRDQRTSVRGPSAQIGAHLRGRPWNVCDWRGIGAILPDAKRGDGWFEGLRQWWRLVSVRAFGQPDWRCAETLANANPAQKAARASMCALVTPGGIAAPAQE